MKESVVNNHFYHIVHKKEVGTYHHIEKFNKGHAWGEACLSS